MDSFPVRRGIGLSRTPHPLPHHAHFAKDVHLAKPMQPQIKIPNLPVQQPVQFHRQSVQPTHNRTLSMGFPFVLQGEKQQTSEIAFKQQSFKQESIQLQIPQTQVRPLSYNNVSIVHQMKSQTQDTQINEQKNTVSTQTGIEERKSIEFSQSNGGQVKVQIQAKSPTKVVPISFKNDLRQIIQVNEVPEIKLLSPPTQSLKLNMILKQKEFLQQQLKKNAQTQQLWQKQRETLLKQIQEANSSLKQLQNKSLKSQQQLMAKLASLESQVRLMKGNKTRLEIDIQNNKKLFKSEREKNQKARQQMNKLIFFEDDLIHAKDYHRLKDELEYVHTENAKLFSQHQQYIIEITQNRKMTGQRLMELQSQIKELKAQLSEYNTKLESLGQLGEEKVLSLKLQGEVNFLRKKCEEQVQQLCQKDSQLQQAFKEIQKLTESQNQKKNEINNVLDEATMRQFNDAIILYQARIADLNNALAKSQNQVERNRKTVQLLTTQLRKSREDRAINSLRERSNENNLKNEVQMLQKGHFTELDLKNKRICNLEDALHRKTKQIVEKDKFIKDFLINRAKSLENSKLEILLKSIKQYFQPQTHLEQKVQENQVSQ